MTPTQARTESHQTLSEVVEDLYEVANDLRRANMMGLSREAAALAEQVSSLRRRLKVNP